MSDASPLRAALLERIRRGGPIGVDEYMRVCLADPEHGYYRRGDPLGAAGDFTTGPEISQIFGELIGLALVQAWFDQGRPTEFALVELGPGRGRLMADALRAASLAPPFLQAARLFLVETSQPLRQAQAEALAGGSLAPEWANQLQDVPDLPLFLVANEFFDALPIRQWRRDPEGWRERLVDAGDGGDLHFTMGEAETPEPGFGDLADAPEGAWFERGAEGEAVAGEVGRRLAASGGAAILIDYAYTAAQRAEAGWLETFQAMRGHAYADPLAAPGEADLTAHVDFSALAAAAEAAGATALGPVGQGRFLARLGAEQRAAALAKANPAKAESLAADLGRLTDPREMGALFKALGLTAKGAPPIAGFG